VTVFDVPVKAVEPVEPPPPPPPVPPPALPPEGREVAAP
jgi:hypothetical protein